MATRRRSNVGISKPIRGACKRLWPDNIVEMRYTLIEESYFHELYTQLHGSLSSMKGASLRYEREAEEQQHNWDDSDWSSPPVDDKTYSYHLFFLCPKEKLFRYATETEEADEEDPDVEEVISGEGFIGCVVGVSLLAPLAVIALSTFDEYENGSHSYPELEIFAFDQDGERITAEEFVRSQVGDEGLRLLYNLCDKIAKVLESHGIVVLSEQEQRKTLPWLRAGEEVIREGGPVTVKEAFFFAVF